MDLYVGDSVTYELDPLDAAGAPVNYSNAALYRITAAIRANRLKATPVTATYAVTVTPTTITLTLTPAEATKLGDLTLNAQGQVEAVFDLQVETLTATVVTYRRTWLTCDVTVTGDVTR